ncbi:MAG TPA: O-antigen ligase family protein [Ktedonobacterales bacterium]|nr:O-antigen ligase family protein [Ktedonobacterales bacterium]
MPRPALPLPRLPLEDLACAAIFAFFAMQGAIPGIAPPAAHEMTAAAFTTLSTVGGIASQAAINALILILLLRAPRLLLDHVLCLPWPALLAALAVASSLWSIDPLLTIRRSLPFALAGLFGLWFAARFSVARQMRILRLTGVALALATIALVILAPSLALDHTPGHAADWQGVFTQKNACGRIMVLATAVILFGARLTPRRILCLGLFLFVLVMSGSRAAWGIEAALLLLWIAVLAARRSSARVRLLIAVAAPLLVAAAAGLALRFSWQLMHLLDREPTLSGRTAIWTQVVHAIAQRPLLGYGYDAFWRGMQGPSLQIDTAVHFMVEHAHNGFLEIALELGLAGLALFLLSWLLAWRRLWPLWHAGDLARVAFPLALLVLIALYDLEENTLLIYNGLFWPLYVASLGTIEFAWRERRHRLRSASHAILTPEQPVAEAVS